MSEAINWENRIDAFCVAWSSDSGEPDFDLLATMYAQDPDVVIYDSLPPLSGFRGFEHMRGAIYADRLASLGLTRSTEVAVKMLNGGAVVVTAYEVCFDYKFRGGHSRVFAGRISQVWERRNDAFVIVHEHPSTTLGGLHQV